MQTRIKAYLQSQKGIYPLVTFRILFGALMAFGTIRTWSNAWIEKLFLEPDFFFKFYGFHWVQHPGEVGIYVLFALIIGSSICIALGLFYRVAVATFFICFSYKELIDASNYLNHYYLVILFAFLLLFLPAHRAFSIDVHWRGTKPMRQIPAIYIDVLLLQMILVYTFAGIAKLNSDWLLHAMPLRIWLPEHKNIPVLGYFFQQEWCAYLFCWGGAIYDLSIAYFCVGKNPVLLPILWSLFFIC